jgi:hypothetical protein
MKLKGLGKALLGETQTKADLLKQKPPSLVEVTEDAMASRQDERGFLRPSSLWKCDRMCVFHLCRAPQNPQKQDARMQRILDQGTATHEVMQGYLADHPEYWFAPEARVDTVVAGVRVRGSCDGILIRRSDGYRFGIEIKTKGNDAFNKLTKPDPDHILQASLYAKLNNVWWITIIYWDKDKQFLKEYPVCYDPAVWASIEERVAAIKTMADEALGKGHRYTHLDHKKLPKFDPKKCDPKFCPFKTFCEDCGGAPSTVPNRMWG